MDKKLAAYLLIALISDIVSSIGMNKSIKRQAPEIAQILIDDGIDFDFLLIIAGTNPDNLKEATDLAFDELQHTLQGGINYVLNHDELPTAE